MESITLPLLIASVFFCGLFGALFFPVAVTQIVRIYNRLRLQARIVGRKEEKYSFRAGLLRYGVSYARPITSLLMRNLWFRGKCEQCVSVLTIKGYEANSQSVCELLVALSFLVALLVFLLGGTLVTAILMPALSVFLVFGRVNKIQRQWEDKLINQIPDTLRSFGICFSAGYSLQQAFEQTARDTPDPLGRELKQASYDVNAGRSIKEALSALESRVQATDLRFALVALEIQHRTGGGLQELLENAAESVVASHDLRRQLAVQTSQAQLSAKVVTILPLVLVVALSLTMEGYLQRFFSSSEGLAILFLALGMEAIGVLIIRRILGVELG